MKHLLLPCLLPLSLAMAMHMPLSPAFTSKSEEMPQQGQYGYLNPQIPQLSTIYGYNPQYATLFQQQQQQQPSTLPQQQIQLWKLPTEIQPKVHLRQTQLGQQPKRPDPAIQPTQHQLSKTIQQPPLKPPTNHQPIKLPQKQLQPAQPPLPTATQKPQTFSPFGNVLNPYQKLWQIPQIYNPGGFPLNPFQRNQYFGYYGFGARPPYNSEEDALENEDAGEPAKEEPKAESPAPDAATNSTASTTNSTAASPPEANQGTNTTNGRNSPSSTGASPPKPNQSENPSTSTPTVNVPNHRGQGGSTLNSYGPNLPNNRGHPPHGDPHPRIPEVKQQTIGGGPLRPHQNSPRYEVHSRQGISRSNPLIIPENKQLVRTGNPSYSNMNPQGYRGHSPVNAVNPSNHKENSQGPTNGNYPDQASGVSQNPKYRPSGNDDRFQNLAKNLSGQRDMKEFPTINPAGQRRISPPYREDIPDYRTSLPHLEGNYPAKWQNGNSLSPREDSHTFPSQQFPKGIFLDQNINPPHPDNGPTDQMRNGHNNWGQEESFPHPGTGPSIPHENVPYPEVEPSIQREIMPSARSDIWNNRDSIPVFEAAQSRQQYIPPYRGRNLYHENNPYDDRGNSFQPRSSTWINRVNSFRDYIGQRGRASDGNFYLENDPGDQRGRMPYADRNTWDYGTNFPAYEANQKSPTDQHGTIYYPEGYALGPGESPPYDRGTLWNQESHSPNLNPSRHRGNAPYLSHDPQNQPFDRMNTWKQEERFPNYSMGPPRQTDYVPYRSNVPYGHTEKIPYSSGNAWDIESNSPVHNRLLPPSERNSWDWDVNYRNQDMAPSDQLENSLYFRSHPAGMRGNLPHREDRDWGYGGEQTTAPESSPTDYRRITAYPSFNKLCCMDNLPYPSLRENVLALKDDSRREKRGSSPYPDINHSKHTRHVGYTPGHQATPQNNSLSTGRNITGDNLLLKQNNSTSSVPYLEVDSDLNITMPSQTYNNEGEEPNITQATEANPLRKHNKVVGSKKVRVSLSTKRKNHEKRSIATELKNTTTTDHLYNTTKNKTADSDVDLKQRLSNSIKRFYCSKNRLRLILSSTGTPVLSTNVHSGPPRPENNGSSPHRASRSIEDRNQKISRLLLKKLAFTKV